jgi:hypothetical protein
MTTPGTLVASSDVPRRAVLLTAVLAILATAMLAFGAARSSAYNSVRTATAARF